MKKGFTLIELLIVIAIIGVVVGIIAGAIGAVEGDGNCNYRVNLKGAKTYCVESYTKEQSGECVYLSEHEVRHCGDYTVTKLIEE